LEWPEGLAIVHVPDTGRMEIGDDSATRATPRGRPAEIQQGSSVSAILRAQAEASASLKSSSISMWISKVTSPWWLFDIMDRRAGRGMRHEAELLAFADGAIAADEPIEGTRNAPRAHRRVRHEMPPR
jgi:hypothetical protein